VLGQTRNVPLNTTTFIAISGNGEVAEDMARRLVISNLDARTDDPEQRKFEGSLLKEVYARRTQLLSAALMIWRWGQTSTEVMRGRSIGSYETWAKWCRDPLLTLGCHDTVERIREIKAADPRRREIMEVFQAWWDGHMGDEVRPNDLCDEVKRLLDPHAVTIEDKDENGEPKYKIKASKQRVTSWLQRHKGTQVGGYRLEEVKDRSYSRPVVTYRLVNTFFGGNGAWASNDNTAPTMTTTNTEGVETVADWLLRQTG
jgi:hypothetical protein